MKGIKITKVESDETKIALLYNDMGYIKHSVETIEQKIDRFGDMYATRKEFVELKDLVMAQTRDIASITRWRYYFTGAAVVIGIVVTKVIDLASSWTIFKK